MQIESPQNRNKYSRASFTLAALSLHLLPFDALQARGCNLSCVGSYLDLTRHPSKGCLPNRSVPLHCPLLYHICKQITIPILRLPGPGRTIVSSISTIKCERGSLFQWNPSLLTDANCARTIKLPLAYSLNRFLIAPQLESSTLHAGHGVLLNQACVRSTQSSLG
jgi:hypothetical protein